MNHLVHSCMLARMLYRESMTRSIQLSADEVIGWSPYYGEEEANGPGSFCGRLLPAATGQEHTNKGLCATKTILVGVMPSTNACTGTCMAVMEPQKGGNEFSGTEGGITTSIALTSSQAPSVSYTKPYFSGVCVRVCVCVVSWFPTCMCVAF